MRMPGSVSAPEDDRGMSEERYDGQRVVDANSGQLVYRVRDARIVDANSGQLVYRIRDDGRVVDANSGQLVRR